MKQMADTENEADGRDRKLSRWQTQKMKQVAGTENEADARDRK